MASFLTKYIIRPLRPLLIKILSLTDNEERVPRSKKETFLQREVHIPTWLVGVLVWAMLYTVVLLEVSPSWSNSIAYFLLTGMILLLFSFYIHYDHPEIIHDEDAVSLLGVLVVGTVLLIEVWGWISQNYPNVSPFGIPLATASLLSTLLLHPRLAVILTILLSFIFGVINGFSLEGTLVFCFGGLAGVARALSVRHRRDITRAGLWVVLGEGVTVLILALLQGWTLKATLNILAWVSGGGIVSALLALSFMPYLETFFSRLTNIRLLELTDVNHPLLKRMSIEAPGTYHHSLIMASLAQAAGEAIGANGLLCRVGAYFHDIGKMVKPEYFVENQGALGNPHDPLPPNMSRLVIQSHVKDGMALARQSGLDKAITDFICMHHGTSRIEYFYRRAIEQSGELEEVDEDEYRYPGPKPFSKETAILMLADSVEASVRTLETPTHQRIQDQIKKILDSKLSDGQFDNVPLTFSDINKISESFVNTLVGVYHSRIKYPEGGPSSPLPVESR